MAVLLVAAGLTTHGMAATFTVPAPEPYRQVEFAWRRPAGTNAAPGVLILVPGFNGSGQAMLDGRWAQFADECGLLLLAPTFRATQEELHRRDGYYYPELWSGAVIEQALLRIANIGDTSSGRARSPNAPRTARPLDGARGRRAVPTMQRDGTALAQAAPEELAPGAKVNTDKILIFGFSAGAHVAHRFALWKPERVKAFVAYSAAWWDRPTDKLRDVPALIMCGEQDERLGATREFFERGLKLDLPFIWRAYRGVGHQMTPAVQRMAEAFLRHYACSAKNEPQAGDVQTYRFVPAAQSNEIPSAVRITLPSRAVAEVWAKEE